MRFTNPFLYAIDWFYSLFIKTGSNLQSLFLFYMRITWGHQLLITGWDKLHALKQTAAFFATLHIPHPELSAIVVAWVEFLGGLSLLIGFASRLFSVPVILVMLTALSTAHAADISNFRYIWQPLSLVKQTPYPFLITSLLIFLFGPGRLSIDAWLKRWAEQRPKF